MTASNGKAAPCTGPCQNMMQAVFSGMDAAAQGWDPVVKSMAQINLEAMGLANRRGQAYLELPARLAACRTPQDVIGEQMRFWQTAMTQYQASSRRILTLWSQAVPELPFATPGARKIERDVLTLPESEAPAPRQGDRRAA